MIFFGRLLSRILPKSSSSLGIFLTGLRSAGACGWYGLYMVLHAFYIGFTVLYGFYIMVLHGLIEFYRASLGLYGLFATSMVRFSCQCQSLLDRSSKHMECGRAIPLIRIIL